jgi:hypothetical protein
MDQILEERIRFWKNGLDFGRNDLGVGRMD